MSEIEELKQQIADRTASLQTKVGELNSRAREILSPENQIQEHPLLCMGLAVAAGVVVGSQIPKGKKILQPMAIGFFNALANELGKKYLTQIEAPLRAD